MYVSISLHKTPILPSERAGWLRFVRSHQKDFTIFSQYVHLKSAYVAVLPRETNIRKTSVFVLLMVCASVYAYVAAVLSSIMLIR